MKIITERAVYVQKNDMAYLNQTDLPIPASIFMKVYGRGVTIIDNSNRYEFIKFEEPSEIDFFTSLDWIIDYNELKDLSEEELINLGKSVAELKNSKATAFNTLPKKERRQKFESVSRELELFDYKMYSIRDLIMFKNGELEFDLPQGVNRPAVVVAEQTVEEVVAEQTVEEVVSEQQPQEQQTENGMKKFIKSIFRKGKK